MVTMADFKAAFHRHGESLEGGAGALDPSAAAGGASGGGGGGGGLSRQTSSVASVTVPPKRIKELSAGDGAGEAKAGDRLECDFKDIKGIKVKTQVQGSFGLVWDSRAIGARTNVSFWSPSIKAGGEKALLTRNRDRVCIGHYAVAGLKDPSKDKALKSTVLALEITDTAVTRFGSVGAASKYLAGAVERLLPHPVRFRQVWNTLGKRTEQHLFAWAPVPPSPDFVALGMVATDNEDPPPVTAVRCVPLRWCSPTPTVPRLLWDDVGTGGKRGSVWVVNSLGLMAIGRGAEAPKEPFYELASDRFFLTPEDLAVLRDEAGGGGSSHGGSSHGPGTGAGSAVAEESGGI